MTSTGNHDANLATCRRLAEQASAERCSMLFLPECCAFIGLNSAEVSSSYWEPLADALRCAAMWFLQCFTAADSGTSTAS
jgi:predicted amidohydrolase